MQPETLGTLAILIVLVVSGVLVYQQVFTTPKSSTSNTKMNRVAPSSLAHVVSGAEYAAQNMAGHQQWNPSAVSQVAQNMQARAQNPAACSGMSSEPAPYFPYSTQGQASMYDAAYPNEQDRSSLEVRGGSANTNGIGQMNINQLLPASWRPNAQPLASEMGGDQLWSRYAPSRAAFDQYITAGSSARMRLNTRSPLGRQVGITDLLRPGTAVPLTADQFIFNDSSFRADLVQRATGRYPTSTNC